MTIGEELLHRQRSSASSLFPHPTWICAVVTNNSINGSFLCHRHTNQHNKLLIHRMKKPRHFFRTPERTQYFSMTFKSMVKFVTTMKMSKIQSKAQQNNLFFCDCSRFFISKILYSNDIILHAQSEVPTINISYFFTTTQIPNSRN